MEAGGFFGLGERREPSSLRMVGRKKCFLPVQNRRIRVVGVVRVPDFSSGEINGDRLAQARMRTIQEMRDETNQHVSCLRFQGTLCP